MKEEPIDFRYTTGIPPVYYNPSIKPIHTMWNGHLFRSRLEARWACFFDAVAIKYYYEMQAFPVPGGGGYLPDFFLPKVEMYGEVKPIDLSTEERAKCAALVEGTKCPCLFLVGPPDLRTYNTLFWDAGYFTETDCLLDIDYHGRRYYEKERRFYCSTSGEFSDPLDFSPEYVKAVGSSRLERFEHGSGVSR